MNYDEILTFLAIAENLNIAKAAQKLYIGQGTASTRLQQLENRLGVKLCYRQKGIKEIILTPEGQKFLHIARQWCALYQEAEHIKELDSFKELRISAVDTLNRFLFPKVYRIFLQKYPNIQLATQTEHSTETYQLIENQQMDLGFVFNLHNASNVIAQPLFRENLVFLYHKGCKYAITHSPEDLKPENELYASYSDDYTLWHNRYFRNCHKHKISLGTCSMLPDFICEEDTWAIVTESIAQNLIQQFSYLSYSQIDDPPPPRTVYMLTHKMPMPWISDITDLFIEELEIQINANPFMTLLYNPPNHSEK